jgi:hypothetical protein
MIYTKEFWQVYCGYSSGEIANKLGGESSAWRKRIRKAKKNYPNLNWYVCPQNQRTLCQNVDKNSKVLTGIMVSDTHYPSHHKRLFANILKYMDDVEVSYFVFGGDQFDMAPVSHWLHDSKNYRSLNDKSLKEDYKGFQRDILDEIEPRVVKDAHLVFLEGNHSVWVEDYIDKHPQGTEGFLEIRNNIDLSKWEWVDYGKSAKIGDTKFIHGVYTNQHHAMKNVQTYHCEIVSAHMHTYQVFTQATPEEDEPLTAYSVPCSCNLNPDYAKNKPNQWVLGFMVFYVDESGTVSKYIVKADRNGSFIAPNGVKYGD